MRKNITRILGLGLLAIGDVVVGRDDVLLVLGERAYGAGHDYHVFSLEHGDVLWLSDNDWIDSSFEILKPVQVS